MPTGPCAPVLPAGPVEPFGPRAPRGPVNPRAPVYPRGPRSPRGPGIRHSRMLWPWVRTVKQRLVALAWALGPPPSARAETMGSAAPATTIEPAARGAARRTRERRERGMGLLRLVGYWAGSGRRSSRPAPKQHGRAADGA